VPTTVLAKVSRLTREQVAAREHDVEREHDLEREQSLSAGEGVVLGQGRDPRAPATARRSLAVRFWKPTWPRTSGGLPAGKWRHRCRRRDEDGANTHGSRAVHEMRDDELLEAFDDRHTALIASVEDIRRRIEELAPWYQNLELADGLWTKDLDGRRDIYSGYDIPAPIWRVIERDLPDITGFRVLDIGCNAGYMSFAVKRLGAGSVLGVDSNFGTLSSFIDQANFCREVLELDVQFRVQSFFDVEPEPQYDLVLFCGVLYHLENYATALEKVVSLAAPGHGLIVLETAIEPVTLTLPGTADYLGDSSTFFVPSVGVLLELVRERGLTVEIMRSLGTRAVFFLRAPAL